MELWQWAYVLLLAVTLGIGWYTSPLIAVGVILVSVIVLETLNHRERRMKKSKETNEKT